VGRTTLPAGATAAVRADMDTTTASDISRGLGPSIRNSTGGTAGPKQRDGCPVASMGPNGTAISRCCVCVLDAPRREEAGRVPMPP
jgi:hypothetical protein